MKIENPEIRTNPFKKSPARKKDGLHQVKIRVFIGSSDFGKFRKKVTLEINILDETNQPVLASSSEFDNRKSNKTLNLTILKTEDKIKDSVVQMLKDNTKLTSPSLFNYLYKKRKSPKIETAADSEETLWNDEVKKFFDGPIPVSVWEKYKLAVIEDDTEDINDEEMQDIADGVYLTHNRDKETKAINNMSFNERYKTGNYDKSNIFELFGYCWSENPKNGESLVTGSYKSLIVQLNDYRFNAKPSEWVKDFNDEWIGSFFKYLIEKGYPVVHFRGYDPFTIVKYRDRLIKSERLPYKEKSFQKVVKHLKRHIDILQKYDLIPYKKNTKLLQASDYLKRKSKKQTFTRREHSLTVQEFNLIADTDFKDPNLNLARDMFIIAVLGGGFRTQELYNDHIYVQNNRIHIYRTKTNQTSTNPIFLQLNDVVKRHNGLPVFLNVDDFRSCLQTIAQLLPLDRIISIPDTFINSKKDMIKVRIKEIFHPYFARKTCVTLLNHLGLSEEELIEFTSHADRRTLKYYKGNMTIEDKERLINSKLSSTQPK
ncbi:MAG: site-specific integrase [Bacteroidales bacterium]|nr:site-specific integrase [Bacteroidales bacterium]